MNEQKFKEMYKDHVKESFKNIIEDITEEFIDELEEDSNEPFSDKTRNEFMKIVNEIKPKFKVIEEENWRCN